MSNITFSDIAWDDYLYWQSTDKATLRKINELIRDVNRNGLSNGIGKPEALKHRKAWSRRIDLKNRFVYTADEKGNILILSLRGHYE